MSTVKRIAAAGVMVLCLYLMAAGSISGYMKQSALERIDGKRMRNVIVVSERKPAPVLPESDPAPEEAVPVLAVEDSADEAAMEPAPEPLPELPRDDENIMETTIRGGLSIKNETGYWVDAPKLLLRGPGITLSPASPQILIIHTHSSEAYTQAGLDHYEASDTNRTENTEFNIVRIGDELTAIYQAAGLNVIHDRGIYDYPSYTGSYTRSGEAIARYLTDYPDIQIVIDMHRDALGSDGVVYKTMAEEEGTVASQIMLLIGTDESGLEHPNWTDNLALALYMQNAVNEQHPTLMRPVDLVRERYNQHLSPGSMIMEVGSSGNTLQEALAAIRLFGNATAPALSRLIQQAE